MSERRRVMQRAASLHEIDEILGAMKSLAFVETHRISTFIDAQRQALAWIEATATDFLADYSESLPGSKTVGDIVCLLGAERGLCGDFNARIRAACAEHAGALSAAKQVVIVGTRLAESYDGKADAVLEGPSVAEEVPVMIARLLHEIATTLSAQTEPLGLLLMYQDVEGVQLRRLLPFTPSTAAAAHYRFPLRLQLSPEEFFRSLTEHHLYALLHTIFYESLLEENRQRLEHMQRARDSLGENLDELERRQRKLRQEEITEEIELILLSAGAVGS